MNSKALRLGVCFASPYSILVWRSICMSRTRLNWTRQHPRFLGVLSGLQQPQSLSAVGRMRIRIPDALLNVGGQTSILGFGPDGIWTARGNSDGSFQPAELVAFDLGFNNDWRVERHPRF